MNHAHAGSDRGSAESRLTTYTAARDIHRHQQRSFETPTNKTCADVCYMFCSLHILATFAYKRSVKTTRYACTLLLCRQAQLHAPRNPSSSKRSEQLHPFLTTPKALRTTARHLAQSSQTCLRGSNPKATSHPRSCRHASRVPKRGQIADPAAQDRTSVDK